MEPTTHPLPAILGSLKGFDGYTPELFPTGANDHTISKVFEKSLVLTSEVYGKGLPATKLSTACGIEAIEAGQKFQQYTAKAECSTGVTSAKKATHAACYALKCGAYSSFTVAQPLNFIETLTGTSVGKTAPSLVGRVSYGLNSFAFQLRNIAAVLFMMVTGYKIYENAKWYRLTPEEFQKKIQPVTVEQIAKKHIDSERLKKLVYNYFEDKIEEVLKRGAEHGLKAALDKEGLKVNIDAKLAVLLADESSGFIKDKESWDLCQKERSDVVEAFGLYIEVMLARQSHRQELKRVFGKEGIQIIHKMQATSEADPESYKAALSICRQRLVLDTLNFVLGVGVMGAIAFTLSASLALPLLAKISKGSPNFEYMNFVMKTFVLGSIVFTPHGLLALTLFSLGFSIHSLVTGGKSKLPFMKSEDLDNYTRWDKLLIQFNIILAALSIFSTGFMGLYVDVPLRATAALAATQVPWLGLNMYGLSEIWKREEAKRAEIRGKIASELVNAKEEGLNIFIKSLLDQYEFESIRQAFLTTPGVQAVQGFETKSGIKRMLDISKTEHEEALAKDLKSEITGYFRALDNAGLIKARETRQTDRWPSTSTLEERNAQAHNELATRRKEHDQAISNIRGVISAAGANSNWEKLMLEHGAPLISQVLEDFESRQDYQEIRKKFTEVRSRTKRRR